MNFTRYTLSVTLLLLLAGCGGTRQIQTLPPQPATGTVRVTDAGNPLASLTLEVQIGESALPAEVRALRFRVEGVRLKPRGGEWVSYPADVNSFDITATRRGGEKTILSTLVPPQVYDSLGLALRDVFVLYDANAGGPLTMARDEPLVLAIDAAPTTEAPHRVVLTMEPGASVLHDAACRWYFLPVFTVRDRASGG